MELENNKTKLIEALSSKNSCSELLLQLIENYAEQSFKNGWLTAVFTMKNKMRNDMKLLEELAETPNLSVFKLEPQENKEH